MHPVLFEIGSFPVSVYGVMVATGMMLAIFFSLRRTRVLGVPDEKLIDLALYGILSGMLGAKLLYIATNYAEFSEDPLGNLRSGLVFYGGFLGSLPVGIWYIQKQKLPFWPMLDAIAPAIPLAHAIGRIGCLFAGCCYGAVCNPAFPLGLRYPRNVDMHSMIFYEPSQMAGLAPDSAWSLPVYPTQLFEAVGNLLIMGILIWLWRRTYCTNAASSKADEALPRPGARKDAAQNGTTNGRVVCLYLIAYGVLRFCIEFLRGDTERGLYFDNLISTSQLIALGLILTGALLWMRVIDPGKFMHLSTTVPTLENGVSDNRKKTPHSKIGEARKRSR